MNFYRRIAFVSILALGSTALGADEAPDSRGEVTLELIMSDPDWIGRAPERPYWADDGKSIYYFQKREGSDERDLIQIDLDGNVLRVVADEDRGTADHPGGDFSSDYRRKVYEREGDLYLKNLRNGELRQLTRTSGAERDPVFMAGDDRIAFRRGDSIFIREIESGLEYEPADLRLQNDPDEKKETPNYLKEQQERLFATIAEKEREEEERRKREKEEQAADPTRAPLPWYLGDKVTIRGSSLSPTGDWLIVRLAKKDAEDGKRDAMPNYVTDTGYVATRNVRTKVGTGNLETETLLLLDLNSHTKHEIDLAALPGIAEDPLKDLRENAKTIFKSRRDAEADKQAEQEDVQPKTEGGEKKEEKIEKPKPRPIYTGGIEWNEDGSRVAVQIFSRDSKDRWIATIDLEAKKLVPIEHMSDPAWINRAFSDFGWLRDGRTLYFLSEESGYSHLYLREESGVRRALTSGSFEVESVRLTRDGRYFYYAANAEHPGIQEVYRLRISNGNIERLTQLNGQTRYALSPDENRLLLVHANVTTPAEIYVQTAKPNAAARRLTQTVSEAFASIDWARPEIVAIPSSHVSEPIYSRVYTPAAPASGKRPAVVFVHGAGYLQNAHHGWSSYFREFMFHTLLTRAGYVVLDMDYRASAGYGRDWRTAIYRQMGTPELQDLQDGVAWLAANRNVDPERVGVYGGSYGGFITLMALFTEPDLFACGAALRPVTDWAHYNHGYTSNILNIPDIDPEAYERSSPIEFAEGLTKPLLICHGMQDDNVFFQDTVRLAQRLIELKKENWEVAIYPIEPHGFEEPTSWLDEYRRIFKLFETHLK